MTKPVKKELQEAGIESFGLGQTPTSEAVTDVNSVVVAADPDMAFCVVTLLTVSAGNVFFAQNVPAVADAGQILTVGTPVKLLGDTSVQMIAGTGAATATIGVQTFKRGRARQGDPV